MSDIFLVLSNDMHISLCYLIATAYAIGELGKSSLSIYRSVPLLDQMANYGPSQGADIIRGRVDF